jgi:hypothetical protein
MDTVGERSSHVETVKFPTPGALVCPWFMSHEVPVLYLGDYKYFVRGQVRTWICSDSDRIVWSIQDE